MKVLVIGGGGREHALVRAILKSDRVFSCVCAPGNGGIAMEARVRCVPVDLTNLEDLLRVVVNEDPALTVIGPELPLSLGLVDEMERRGLRAFGPTRSAARLETSKSFAKEFMQRHHIPTARYAICGTEKEVRKALGLFHEPLVVKADGLAAGKGVIIAKTKDEALAAAVSMLSGSHKDSGGKVVLEECLTGEEISFLVLSDGKHVAPLAPAQDHKRIGEGDTGANTGGMGAYSTDALLDASMSDWILLHIVQPAVDGMAQEGAPFKGVLFCGLMMTAKGPMALEFNARFGDPETEALLPRLDSDLVAALEACVDGRLSETEVRWKPQASACVVAASGGYPAAFATGEVITGVGEAARIEGVSIFHSGTALAGGKLVTSGGRVLAVTALSNTLSEALALCYEALSHIHFEGMYYRRDIGHRAAAVKR